MKHTRNYLIASQLITEYKVTGSDNTEILIKLQNLFNELSLEDEGDTLELIVTFFQEVYRDKETLSYLNDIYLALA